VSRGAFPFLLGALLFLPSCPSHQPLRPPRRAVRTGLDRLVAGGFAVLRGKRVGLVCNPSSVDGEGRHAIDLLRGAPDVALAAIFAPEHGLRGSSLGEVEHGRDEATGLPVWSLYGEVRKPTPAMLAGLDVLVFDVQDVGARFYTYVSTMALAMEAAAEAGIPFVVLDRPNPIGGEVVEGPLLDPALRSFVGVHPIALRHGMTLGELARLFAARSLDGRRVDLLVVPCEGWRRDALFPETGIRWVPPSPNMPDPETALVYPGTCLLEATNLSEGRGTPTPFRLVGAPWVDGDRLASALAGLPDVVVGPARFTPRAIHGKALNPRHLDRECGGVRIRVREPARFRAVEFGVRLLCAVRDLHPGLLSFSAERFDRLAGARWLREAIERGEPASALLARLEEDAARFRGERAPYLLYPFGGAAPSRGMEGMLPADCPRCRLRFDPATSSGGRGASRAGSSFPFSRSPNRRPANAFRSVSAAPSRARIPRPSFAVRLRRRSGTRASRSSPPVFRRAPRPPS
jgi:uncharacterized protein YbbC (DUF1343 family)